MPFSPFARDLSLFTRTLLALECAARAWEGHARATLAIMDREKMREAGRKKVRERRVIDEAHNSIFLVFLYSYLTNITIHH